MTQLRVMTYNILSGGRRGAPLDRVVRAAEVDVLLVNESPKLPWLSRFLCRRLARRWGMRYVVGGRSAGANLIVVTDPVTVLSRAAEVLPQPLFRPRRGVASAQLRVHGDLLGVVACHLSLDQERRLAEDDRVIQIAGSLHGPVVVAGDLNEPPDGPAWRRLRGAGFVDHGSARWRTFPADSPTKRIDALLVRGPVGVTAHGDPGLPPDLLAAASDHRPVLAVLDL